MSPRRYLSKERTPRTAACIGGGEEGIQTLNGVAPKPHFQFASEEGSEGFLAPTEASCPCLEGSGEIGDPTRGPIRHKTNLPARHHLRA